MYKIYFRQAIKMLKQNKFISIIAILGTAVAIMMIMAIVVSDEIKNINISPENKRDRTFYADMQIHHDSVGSRTRQGSITYPTLTNYLYELKQPEQVTAIMGRDKAILNAEGMKKKINAKMKFTDAAYWKFFDIPFLQGQPFTQEEFTSGIPCVVLSENIAKTLFTGQDAMGKTVEINFVPYRVIGIARDISPIFKNAQADAWAPYTSVANYKQADYKTLILGKNKKDLPAINREVRNVERTFNQLNPQQRLYIDGPKSHWAFINDVWGTSESEVQHKMNIQKRKMIFILIILLLVPAINLSGISLSRIKKRTAEIGVRKAFGAKKYIILVQVLYENFITSLIGGVLGLFLSYLTVFWMRKWLLGVPADSVIPVHGLISPPVFLAVFVACLLLNLLSAGLPAYKASRMNIINSLNQNDRKS